MHNVGNKDHMNIICSCDANYVPCCGIMLTSVFENNKESLINVYVFCNLHKVDISELEKLSTKYGQSILFINIEDELVKRFPIKETDYITRAAYYRLLVTEYLPKEVEMALYLDCDIIVNKSLIALYNSDILDYSAAVVLDCNYYLEERIVKLGIKNANTYFNSGVLLLNLRYWRENDIFNKIVFYNNAHSDLLDTHDQDLLNVVLMNTVKYLPINYNFQTGFLHKRNLKKYNEALHSTIMGMSADDIVIWHYSTPVKPWNNWYFAYPNYEVWEKYKNLSNWQDWKKKHTFRDWAHCHIQSFLYVIGLKKKEFESVCH